ncbi:Histidine kinase-, DNA gyrase B-, and HSP90-like ATPase [Pedobacter westerhofensis]|uniref:histidine kinase n=1 Tax=Pedobacter westerhofensis TaxID=425512 RepID=A0A521FUF8_9SPHI|nr:HAMP domain-containing sensor histidine kinase [Pedobacter westerhofensis]SMO99829.1 Histidine kinase-, DNA gyrase B-, and HSP90-like ATPase [Pedobacter westerhofensis]
MEQSIAIKNKLFSIISHDLRGPAASLKQAHELIDEGAIAIDELPLFLKMLKKQSTILNETLDSLLMWSRAQLDEIQINPIHFDILESINKTLALLEGQFGIKDLIIKNNIFVGTIAYLDKNQFEFIIRNMLSNAIKFSHQGGQIELDLQIRKNYFDLLITDHGIGISPERQNQFSSGSLETTSGTLGEKGTGLGLRMVMDFMSSIGGKIQLTSTSDETCFRLTFPNVVNPKSG